MAVIANGLFRVMAGDRADSLIRRPAFEQLGNGLMPEAPGRDPPEITGAGDAAEGSTDEEGAGREVGIVESVFYPKRNQIMLRFDRSALLGLRDEITNGVESNVIERHTSYPEAVFDRHWNSD